MTSMKLLLLFGACITFSSFVLAPLPSGYIPRDDFKECKNISDIITETWAICFRREFTEGEVDDTSEMFNDTKCVQCSHICRKQPQIMHCLKGSIDALKNLSNKSQVMVPPMGQLIEIMITTLCENGTGLLPASTRDEKQCFPISWFACNSNFEFMGPLEAVAFCDSANPKTDPFNMEFICQKIADYLDCTEKSVEECSTELMTSVNILKNTLKSSEQCAQYY